MRSAFLPVLPVLLVAALASGCSDDDPATTPTANQTTDSASATASPTGDASASPSPSLGEGATGEDGEEPTAPAEQPFRADRSEDTAEGSGKLSVVDVRTGRHDGYDRVVFELAGQGTPGWSVQYDENPSTPGEGAPVELAGDATLSVLITGVGYPFDTGVEEYDGPRRQSPGLPVVKELQLGGVFEGYYDAFVGVAQDRPFRVFRLDDPARVVLDVAHTG